MTKPKAASSKASTAGKEKKKKTVEAKPVAAKKSPASSKAVSKAAAVKDKKASPKAQAKSSKAVELTDRQTAQKMMDSLCQLYPDAECELDYDSDFQLLTSVILSAQTTDAQVNKVTPSLFKRFPTAQALAAADLDDVKEIVKPTGYYNAKATSIQKCAQALVDRFGGQVPDNLEELVTLPGVGRKTANVVLGVIHKLPAWTVDTHVQRLSKRFGFTNEDDPYKIELDLQKLFEGRDWSRYSITIIWHGRRMCYARKPNCTDCPINNLCPSAFD